MMKFGMRSLLKSKSATLLLPVVVIGCAAPMAFNPQTGNVAMQPASSTIQAKGAEAFDAHRRKTPVSRDGAARARVFRVASRLERVIHLPGTRWEFEVFEDSSANAFAVPGGKVGVNTGLLRVAKTDGQLAAVLAHEMAHVTSNHAEARVQRSQTIAIGGALLGAVIGGGEGSSGFGDLATKGGTIAFGLTFSRQQELEADKIGTIFMARAGYDPAEAVTLWENMAAQNRSATPEFLSTHPVTTTRINELRAFLPQARAQQR
ncbi:MAG: M48 family metallopeptidase [Verrucomicrobiaceae bacterium]